MTCRSAISDQYRVFVRDYGLTSRVVEEWFRPAASPLPTLDVDLGRNEADRFTVMFDAACRGEVEALYTSLCDALKSATEHESADILNGFCFLQTLLSSALWKYEVVLSQELLEFTKNFDRWDVPAEREALRGRILADPPG